MIYIYDILVNFNDRLYDFYEWNSSDSITHIRKIPLLKVSSLDLMNICSNAIKVDKTFLDKIEKKCEAFTTRNIEIVKYAVLFSDGDDVICVRFDSNGLISQFSKLLVDEAEEVIDVVSRHNISSIDYKIVSGSDLCFNKTRLEIEKSNYVYKELKRLDRSNDIEKLKYLFFECFNELSVSKSNIIERLYKELDNWNSVNDVMYDFFKLISVNR